MAGMCDVCGAHPAVFELSACYACLLRRSLLAAEWIPAEEVESGLPFGGDSITAKLAGRLLSLNSVTVRRALNSSELDSFVWVGTKSRAEAGGEYWTMPVGQFISAVDERMNKLSRLKDGELVQELIWWLSEQKVAGVPAARRWGLSSREAYGTVLSWDAPRYFTIQFGGRRVYAEGDLRRYLAERQRIKRRNVVENA